MERTEKLVDITERYKNILVEAVDAIITFDQKGLIESFCRNLENHKAHKWDNLFYAMLVGNKANCS